MPYSRVYQIRAGHFAIKKNQAVEICYALYIGLRKRTVCMQIKLEIIYMIYSQSDSVRLDKLHYNRESNSGNPKRFFPFSVLTALIRAEHNTVSKNTRRLLI